ncbi:MAG: hypothetical protein HFJ65_06040 [Eggerthellaceae bacterium]|nr:hypothetical protein [Eggerthellaceae bacterium]
MRKERIRELDQHIHLTDFQPKSFVNEAPAGGPLVSIYVPIKRTDREDRPGDWDRIEFKDLCKEAYRRLDEGTADYEGIKEKLDFIMTHEDLPLWVDSSQGLAFLVTNQDAYVINMNTAPEACVVVGPQFYLKPLFRDAMFQMSYKLLLLNADFFALLDGDYNGVYYQELPKDVKDYFAQEFADYDGQTTALDYYSLEGHESPYHDHKSRNDVKKEEAEKFFRYVDKAMNDKLVRDNTDPIILVTAPEHEHAFREICTFNNLLPECIKKDPRTLSGTELKDDAVKIIMDKRNKGLAEAAEDYSYKASKDKATDSIPDIGLALVERKVDILFLEEGKGIPGTFDDKTGEVTFDGSKDPVDDKKLDPASPDIAGSFAEACVLEDGKVLVLPADQMPTKTGIAATYRF